MDLQMPEMGGMEATAAIRAREISTGTHIPIIAMTAHAMTGDRERCMDGGMDGYLSKPIKAELLYTTVEELATPASMLADPGMTQLSAEERAPTGENQRPSLESVNMEAVEGDEELFIEIAHLFLEGDEEMLTLLQDAIRIGDGPALALAGTHPEGCSR